MKKNKEWNNYWIKRQQKLLDETIDELEAILAKDYKETLARLRVAIADAYLQIKEEEENVLVSHLYQYNKYYELISKIEDELDKLGKKEIAVMPQYMKDLYIENQKIVSEQFSLSSEINKQAVDVVVHTTWAPNSLNWSDSIWKNKQALAEMLRQGLIDILATGRSHKELSKMINDKFDSGFYNAERLVRTELARIQIQSTLDRYKDAGVERYKIIAAKDDRVCENCVEHDNEIHLIEEAEIGVTIPVFHPNCRCTIVAVV